MNTTLPPSAPPRLRSLSDISLDPDVRVALAEAAATLHGLYGERLAHLVLFGSQARGEAHDESDVDVLVVLDGPFRLYEEVKRVVDIQMDLMERYGCLLAFTLLPESRYASTNYPLMMNVRREGVTL